MSATNQKRNFENWVITIIITIIVLIILFADKIRNYTHESILHAVIFWLFLIVFLIIAILFIFRNRIFKIKEANKSTGNDRALTYDNSRWVDVTKEQSPLLNNLPRIDTTENLTLRCIKQFKPRWINRDGKFRLEGGENGNNANLAQHLRNNNIPDVETEITLKNGSRADLMIDNQIIIECKPHLLSVEKMHSISGEIRRVKRIGNYKVFALIYGDAKSYLLNDLKADIGENNVIVLGKVNTD